MKIEYNIQTGERIEIPLTPEEEAEQIAAEAASIEEAKPKVVSMRQARLALLQQNLLNTVNAVISAGNEADRITWEYATEVNRNDALVVNLTAALGFTSQQLDDLFTLASTL